MPDTVGLKVTLNIQLEPAASAVGQLLFSVKSSVISTAPMFSGKLPVLVRVTACEELEVPTGWDENVSVETDSAATAPAPMPLKLML